jgi:hypothetical protein
VLLASGASARVDLSGATISGGKLQTVSGGVIETVGDVNVLSRGTITSGSLIKVNDGTELRLAGLIANSGTISVGGSSSATELSIDATSVGATLSGGGKVILSPSGMNSIEAGFANTPFTNINNTIAGAGQIGIGNNELLLTNSGTINANTASALIIETGPDQVVNAGILEATSTGGLFIDSNVLNSKTIQALGTSAVVVISGVTITNTASGVILASGSGAHIDLAGAAISGGKLQTVGSNAVIETLGGSTSNVLSGGSTAAGSLLKVTDGTKLTFEGAVANAGTIAVSGTASATALALGGVTITGPGKLATWLTR